MIESQTSIEMTNRNLMLIDDYCNFQVKLYNDVSFTLILHKKDTLYDLHQKLMNRLRLNRIKNPVDFIPPSNSITRDFQKDKICIHDIFICRDNISDIVSIPSSHTLLISEFIDMHKSMFDKSNEYHNIYVIDDEYYSNFENKNKKKKSFMKIVLHTILCKI